MSIGR